MACCLYVVTHRRPQTVFFSGYKWASKAEVRDIMKGPPDEKDKQRENLGELQSWPCRPHQRDGMQVEQTVLDHLSGTALVSPSHGRAARTKETACRWTRQCWIISLVPHW